MRVIRKLSRKETITRTRAKLLRHLFYFLFTLPELIKEGEIERVWLGDREIVCVCV